MKKPTRPMPPPPQAKSQPTPQMQPQPQPKVPTPGRVVQTGRGTVPQSTHNPDNQVSSMPTYGSPNVGIDPGTN